MLLSSLPRLARRAAYRTLSSKEEEEGARARSDIGIDTDNEAPTNRATLPRYKSNLVRVFLGPRQVVFTLGLRSSRRENGEGGPITSAVA